MNSIMIGGQKLKKKRDLQEKKDSEFLLSPTNAWYLQLVFCNNHWEPGDPANSSKVSNTNSIICQCHKSLKREMILPQQLLLV